MVVVLVAQPNLDPSNLSCKRQSHGRGWIHVVTARPEPNENNQEVEPPLAGRNTERYSVRQDDFKNIVKEILKESAPEYGNEGQHGPQQEKNEKINN